MALLLLCTFTSQAENDLTTTQITLNIKSGELQSEVESSGWQWNQITNLKLVGELNVDDLQFIRKMVGCYYNENGDKYDGHLQHLDIVNVDFVGNGSFKVYYGDANYHIAKFETSCIGDYLFSHLDGLQTIVLPSCVNSIYYRAFNDCSGLVSVTMPENLISIEDYAFSYCNGLTSIYANMLTPAIITDCAFDENIETNTTLYIPKGTYQEYMAANCWKNFLKIKEVDPAGVESTYSTSDVKEISRYTINGQHITEPTTGLNIIKYSDGSFRKVIIQ